MKIPVLFLVAAIFVISLHFLLAENTYFSEKQSQTQNQLQEVISKRTRTGKVFKNTNEEDRYVYEGGITPIHYESQSSGLKEIAEINLLPYQVENDLFEGWMATENGWHFSIGNDKERNEDGWIGFGGREGKNWFKYRLKQMGFFDTGQETLAAIGNEAKYDRELLELDTETTGFSSSKSEIASELRVRWRGLWPEYGQDSIYLQLKASGDSLKEEVVIANNLRDKLLSQSRHSAQNQHFGFVFELDMTDIPKIVQNDIERLLADGEGLVPGEKVELRDELDQLIAFMPVDDLILLNDGEEIQRLPLNKYLYQKEGAFYLFIGLESKVLESLPEGDLVFDPTINEQVDADGNDGFWNVTGSQFLNTHNANFGRSGGPGVVYHSFFRFTDVTISGIINEAEIEFRAGNSNTTTFTAHIFAEDADNPTAPTSYSDVESRPTTSSYVSWVDPAFTSNQTITSPDLSSVVQELVDSYTISGDAITFFFKTPSGQDIGTERKVRDYFNNPANAAKLYIDYTESSSGSISQSHYRWRDDSAGINTNSGWEANEDTPLTSMEIETSHRLRLAVDNTSGSTAANYLYQLEYAPKNGEVCGDNETFVEIPATATTEHFEMVNSSQYSDGDTISSSFLSGAGTFANGEAVEYPSYQTDSHSLSDGNYTELEFAIMANSNSQSGNYCFRLTNDGTELGAFATYNYAEATMAVNSPPSAPQVPYMNNNTAQSGQSTPVYGITDHTPAFSAIFDDPNSTDTAEYAQVQVSSYYNMDPVDMWDSSQSAITSCDNGNRCEDIIYDGSTLNDGNDYYWRIRFWDNEGEVGTWSSISHFYMNSNPSVTQVSLNDDADIVLSAGTTTTVQWEGNVTDPAGYEEFDTAFGKVYRLGSTEACTADDLDCYDDADCQFSNCSGNSCTVTCSADIQYFADSTDASGEYPSDSWRAWIAVFDTWGEGNTGLSAEGLVDLSSLVALDVDNDINYGAYSPGEDSGSNNTLSTITNIGNVSIDAEISGSNMCTDYPACSGSVLDVDQQKYSGSSFTYSSGGTALTGSATELTLNLAKASSTSSPSSTGIYWGIGIPSQIGVGVFTGENTVVAESAL